LCFGSCGVSRWRRCPGKYGCRSAGWRSGEPQGVELDPNRFLLDYDLTNNYLPVLPVPTADPRRIGWPSSYAWPSCCQCYAYGCHAARSVYLRLPEQGGR